MEAMTSPASFPQRLSDGEREAAVAALRAHLDAGRLSGDEFAQRSDAARAALTASDVVPLFTDLPAPHPLYLNMAQPTWNTYPGGTTSAPTYAPEPGAPTYQTPYQQTPPTYSGTVVPTSQGPLSSLNPKTLSTIHALIWPVAIVLFVTGNGGIWVIIAAIVASSLLGGYQRRGRRQPPPY